MNFGFCKIYDPHRLLIIRLDRINLKRSNKYIDLSYLLYLVYLLYIYDIYYNYYITIQEYYKIILNLYQPSNTLNILVSLPELI